MKSWMLLLYLLFTNTVHVDCFQTFSFLYRHPRLKTPATTRRNAIPENPIAKTTFFESLNHESSFNTASKSRTDLLNDMIITNPTEQPGSLSSFESIAPGTWRIIYAPHISTLSGLLGGSFDPVLYEMKAEKMEIISHAKYSFPILGEGWLSVSGTYGTYDDDCVCRVDFDRAWIGIGSENRWTSFDQAPNVWYKGIINAFGQLGFRKEFAVFPVSYLDDDTIVFDFELFGTRICARKVTN